MGNEVIKKLIPLVKKPSLISRRGVEAGFRRGRGFSVKELEMVGLSVRDAKRLGLRIDPRRRSAHEENVKLLREYLKEILK